MIFAKIDVTLPRHYRILGVRRDCVRIPGADSEHSRDASTAPSDDAARTARSAALGVWTAVLCYSREAMLDGYCPMSCLRDFATDGLIDELVAQGLLAREERDGRPGVVLLNYAKHNETRTDIDRRLNADRSRKKPERVPAPGLLPHLATEPKEPTQKAPTSPDPRPSSADQQALIAHFAAEFERLKGAKPVIAARGAAGARSLLQGRTLADAKAIIDRALADPWWLDKSPDLGAIAGKINAFIGRKTPAVRPPQPVVQPSGGAWKRAETGQ